MGDHNSPYLELGLIKALLKDVATHYPSLAKDLARDAATVERRVHAEGKSFLTTTLSQLGKAIDRSFQTGQLHAPTSFVKQRGTALPVFLRGLTSRVFDSGGALRDDADVDCVAYLRQLLLCFSKYELPYKGALVEAKLRSYIQTEAEAFEHRDGVHTEDYTQIVLLAQDLIHKLLRKFDVKTIRSKHGPGAVATGERADQKWTFKRLYSSIHAVFPYPEYYFYNFRDFLDRVLLFQQLELCDTGVSKTILVPKDYRGPRVIDEQPLEYQFIQQGMRVALYEHLETHPLTAGHVNFTDQTVNQHLAYLGSLDGSWETLDFKDASDRNSTSLVRLLWARVPHVLRALLATRTNHTMLPGGEIMPLKKFAPMGSALCFPVMAVNIWALTIAAMRWRLKWPLRRCLEKVYIYGDDLIVATGLSELVLRHLPAFGFRVNVEKSYTTGPFRESCGLDAFRGINVTPQRVRTLWNHEKRLQCEELVSWVEYANGFYTAGYWQSAQYLRQCIQRRASFFIPSAMHTSSCTLSWKFFTQGKSGLGRSRWNRDLQRAEHKAPSIKTRQRPSYLDGWAAMHRSTTELPRERTITDASVTTLTCGFILVKEDSPRTVAVPRSATTKPRWQVID